MAAYLLEVIACSVEDAVAAQEGGADRLELCSRLDLRGLTPPAELTTAIAAAVSIPIRVMIRTNDSFQATEAELQTMEQQVEAIAGLRVEGMVTGFADERGNLDFRALDRLVSRTPAGWKLTLHTVFDAARGTPEEKLEAVLRHGRAGTILTGAPPEVLSRLTARISRLPEPGAGNRIALLAGGGLSVENVPKIAAVSGLREFHFGRAARLPKETTAPVNQAEVRALRLLLDGLAGAACTA